MSMLSQMTQLTEAVRNADTETAHGILSGNPNLLKLPENRNRGSELLVLTVLKHYSEKINFFNIFELLIKFGADVSAASPLEPAMAYKNLQFAELLLQNGAKPTSGAWPKCFSRIQKGNLRKDMLLLLKKYQCIDAKYKSPQGENLLMLFLRHYVWEKQECQEELEVADILIDAGVSIDEEDGHGHSPLILISFRRRLDWFKFLIKRGADVNRKNKFGQLLLILVTTDRYQGDVDIVEFLLSNGARINAQDAYKNTALHQACFIRNDPMISLLIRWGADLTLEDEHGNTPFGSLFFSRQDFNDSLKLVIKGIAKLSYQKRPVCETDVKIIQEDWEAKAYFKACKSELSRARNTKFYESYSYYSVLTEIGIKKLARLVIKKEFMASFEKKLSRFPLYEDDLREVLQEAMKIEDELQIIEGRLKSVFGDSLPSLAIRSLAENLTVDDLLSN